MYKIATYLTDEDKAAALAYEYGWKYGNSYFMDSEGFCPLGRVSALHTPDYGRRPTASEIGIILEEDSTSDRRHDIVSAAAKFMEDWDSGKIKNLRKALGIKDKTLTRN